MKKLLGKRILSLFLSLGTICSSSIISSAVKYKCSSSNSAAHKFPGCLLTVQRFDPFEKGEQEIEFVVDEKNPITLLPTNLKNSNLKYTNNVIYVKKDDLSSQLFTKAEEDGGEKVEQSHPQNNQLEIENTQLKEEIKKLKMKNEKLYEKNHSLSEQLTNKNRENESLSQKNTELLKQLQDKNEKMNCDKQQAAVATTVLEEENSKFKKGIKFLKSKNKRLSEENSNLFEQLTNKKQENKLLLQKNTELSQENNLLLQENTELSKLLKDTNEKMNCYATVTTIVLKNGDSENELYTLAKKEGTFQNDIQVLKSAIENETLKLKNKKYKKLQETQKKIDESKQKLKVIFKEQYHIQLLQKIILEIKQLENIANRSNESPDKISDLDNNLEKIKTELSKLEEKIKQSEYQKTDQDDFIINLLLELLSNKHKIIELEQKKIKLLDNIALKDEEIVDLKQQLSPDNQNPQKLATIEKNKIFFKKQSSSKKVQQKDQLLTFNQQKDQIPIEICKEQDSQGKEITYYANTEMCKYLFEIVFNFFNLSPEENSTEINEIEKNKKIINNKAVDTAIKELSRVYKKKSEEVFHNLDNHIKLSTNINSIIEILNTYNIKHIIEKYPLLLKKISKFAQRQNELNHQINQLKNTLELERKQISNSLIVMNQQYERRINVMQTYFIRTTYYN
ncbi:MAG: hypothetical protein LBT82_03060 [Oscillospiraceae bacterium]|jgi:hypothetical protein|nr:hypothetical protein [Oscillospiraceae bacterium]